MKKLFLIAVMAMFGGGVFANEVSKNEVKKDNKLAEIKSVNCVTVSSDVTAPCFTATFSATRCGEGLQASPELIAELTIRNDRNIEKAVNFLNFLADEIC